MTRICHITTAHPTFDGRIFHKQCVSLAKAGYVVFLVTTHHTSEMADGVRIIPLSPSRGRLYRFFIKTIIAFFKALRTRSRIYHIHDPELLPAAIALKLCGKKVIFDMHELIYHQIADKDYIRNRTIRKTAAWVYKKFEGLGIRIFDKIILAEDGYLGYFEREYPGRLNKLVFVRNYPIISLIDEVLKKNQTAESRDFTLVYAGSLSKIRGIYEICEAVKASKYPVKLLLLGIWSEESFREKCDISNDRISYLGIYPLPKVYEVMQQSDIGFTILYPVENHLTSLPVKNFEYMACGLPMIMSDFPYWRETFDGTAVFANPNSIEEITKAIEWSFENRSELTRMGEKGFMKVRNSFSWEVEVNRLKAVYEELSA